MPPTTALPIHRLIFASIVATAAGAVACTWSLGYLDDRPDAGASNSSSAVSTSGADAGTGAADANTGTGTGEDSATASDAPVQTGPYTGDGGNLIVNPSCENGVLSWTTLSGTPVESSTVFVHGSDTASCCAYDRTDPETTGETSGPSYDGPMQDITEAVVAGHSYTVSAWVLWAPPDAGPPGDAGDASAESSDGAAVMGSDASADAGADADAGYGPQGADITVKATCGTQTATYTRLGSATDIPQETWTQIVGTSLLTVMAGCDLQLYVEGPDMGLNLYVDEVTLLYFQ